MDLLVIAAAITAILLAWNLLRSAGARRASSLNETRRGTSRLKSAGELLLGGVRRRRVLLEVTDSALHYEGSRAKGSLELDSVLEIEYDTVTASGLDVLNGRVLRLRTASETLEFVLPRDTVTSWYMVLPPHPERVRAVHAPATTSKIATRTPVVWLR